MQNYINRIGMHISYGGDGIETGYICEINKEHIEEGLKEIGLIFLY